MTHAALLLFDLGGVLIENAVFDSLNPMLPQPLDSVAIRERWLTSPAVRGFELGRIPATEFAEQFIAEWNIAMTPQAFLEAFNALHWAKFDGFEGVFDIALSSHLLGVIKPDEAAFVRALAECRVPAEDVVFFDDSQPNVKMAQSLGIRAFHVDGFAALMPVLQAEGLM